MTTSIAPRPPNCCRTCGDGTQPGHDLCDGCEREKEQAKPGYAERYLQQKYIRPGQRPRYLRRR